MSKPVTRTPQDKTTDKKDEAAFLDAYRPGDFARPSVTVDLVILTIKDGALAALLVTRGEHPFKGALALPGGFLRVGKDRNEQGEDLIDAARRELAEETGLGDARIFLTQLGAFGRPGRDPRMRVISVAFVALVRPELAEKTRGGGDVTHAQFVDVSKVHKLAFDHGEILAAARTLVQRELLVSPIAFELTPETFTIQELRGTYEVILGEPLDPGNFRKRFLRMLEEGIISETREMRRTPSKPARLYRFAKRARS
jgi:8-oxo-dGTP diphosphatase